MTKAQKNFVNFYIEQDFQNAAQAYTRAFPRASEESARRNASRLLTRADVQDCLSEVLAAIIKRERIPLEKRIFDVWVRRAFYDPAEIIDSAGALLYPLEELSRRGLAICVEGIETRVSAKGVETVKVKLADRDQALEQLQSYIAMIKPQPQKVEIAGISEEAAARLEQLYQEEAAASYPQADVESDAPDC